MLTAAMAFSPLGGGGMELAKQRPSRGDVHSSLSSTSQTRNSRVGSIPSERGRSLPSAACLGRTATATEFTTILAVLASFYLWPYAVPGDGQAHPAITSTSGWKQAVLVDVSWAASFDPQFYVFAAGTVLSVVMGGLAMLHAGTDTDHGSCLARWCCRIYRVSAVSFMYFGIAMALCRNAPSKPSVQQVHQIANILCLTALWVCSVIDKVMAYTRGSAAFRWPRTFPVFMPPFLAAVWFLLSPTVFPEIRSQTWTVWLIVACLVVHLCGLQAGAERRYAEAAVFEQEDSLLEEDKDGPPESGWLHCSVPLWCVFLPGMAMQLLCVIIIAGGYTIYYMNQPPDYVQTLPALCVMSEASPVLRRVMLAGCFVMTVALAPLDLALADYLAVRSGLAAGMSALTAMSVVVGVTAVSLEEEPFHTYMTQVWLLVRIASAVVVMTGLRCRPVAAADQPTAERLAKLRAGGALVVGALSIFVGMTGVFASIQGPIAVLELSLIPMYCLGLTTFLYEVGSYRIVFDSGYVDIVEGRVSAGWLDKEPDGMDRELPAGDAGA